MIKIQQMKKMQTIEQLRRSILVFSVLSVLIVGVIVAVVAVYPLFTQLKKDLARNLLDSAKAKKMAIEQFLGKLERTTWQITSRTKAREKLEQYNREEVSLQQFVDFSRPILGDALHLSKEAVGCLRFDKNRKPVVQVGLPIPESFWVLPREEETRVRMHGPVALADALYVVVGAPIFNRKKVRVGTDLVMFQLDELRIIVQDQTGLGETGETILGMAADKNRARLFFTPGKKAEKCIDYVDLDSPLGWAMEQASHLGRDEYRLLTSSFDRSQVFACGSIPDINNWAIVVRMNAKELYAPIKQQVITICLVIFTLLLLGTLVTIFLLRPLAGKIIIHSEELEFINQQLLHEAEERKRNNAINVARMRLMQFASNHSLDDFLEETLNEAEKLTQSRISFYVFVEDDQVSLTLQNWSARTKAEFCKAKGKGLHYNISEAGVWVDCIIQGKPVIHNDYASLPHRKGMPEGHAELIRELVVPVRRGDKIKAVVAVGNKPGNYDETDVEAVSLIADLTWELAERKRAEEKMLRSDQRLRLHSEQSPLGFLEWDDNFHAIEWNAACERIFGYTREEAIGRHAKDLILPLEVHDLVDGIYDSLMNQTGGQHNINENITKDGRIITCEWFNTTLIDKDGKAIGIASVCRDITEQKRMEVELARYREHLEEQIKERTIELEIAKNKAQQYLDIAGVILVAIDKNQRVTLINQKGCDVLGSTAREIIGKNWFETFVPENERRYVIQGFRQLMAGELEPVEYFENTVLTQGGEERLIAWHNTLLKDGDGNITGTLSSGEDITAKKRVEEQIMRLNQDLRNRAAALEEAIKELEAFAYSVSHDLRAPLRHIDGFLALLQKKAGTALDEQSRHYLDKISDAAQKMGQLIDNLLTFSRMGRHAMSYQQVEMGPLVLDVIREMEPDVAARNIAWRIGDLPVVSGDPTMLRMVLVNLIANALKFTRSRQQAKIEIGSLPGRDSETVMFVRDNGVGFDMAYADKLFGVFQRLHHAEEFEGTGIGLANVHRIITRHGGRTWAEGNIDEGATFYFSLPRTKQGEYYGRPQTHSSG